MYVGTGDKTGGSVAIVAGKSMSENGGDAFLSAGLSSARIGGVITVTVTVTVTVTGTVCQQTRH
jgi:hypothetical protein